MKIGKELLQQVLMRRKKSDSTAPDQGAAEKTAKYCYYSLLSGCSLEIDEKSRLVILTGRGNRHTRQIGFDDIATCEVIVNEAAILKIERHEEDAFDLETKHRLRTTLRELQHEQMGPEATRQIDIRISGLPESGFLSTVNFYYREGNRRLTDHSYTDTVQDIVKWCGMLNTAMHQPASQSEEPEINEEAVTEQDETTTEPETDRPSPTASRAEDPDTEESAEAAIQEDRNSSAEGDSVVSELTKLVMLKEQGYLTDEEFEKAKAKIIN